MLTQSDLRPDQLLIRKIRRLANAALHREDEDEDVDGGYIVDDSVMERKKMRASTVEAGGKFRVELKDEEEDDDDDDDDDDEGGHGDGDGDGGQGGQGRSGRRGARRSGLNDDEIYD